ncbi:hypothetical protein ScPMuIL_008712 [Solemya velum]
MSFQWTVVATFLYVEIGVVVTLMLPFISPSRWQKIFKSRLINSLAGYSYIYFNVFIAILVLLVVDAIREVRKYATPEDTPVDLKHNPDAENLAHMKLFRAQRNFYIAGFALFLWFVIRRLVILISVHATVKADCEANKRQAQSATDAARRLLEDKENKTNKTKEETLKESEDTVAKEKSMAVELDTAKEELIKTKNELKRLKLDFETLQRQAEGTNKEYDRLLGEHGKLQEKVDLLANENSKKDK